MASGDIYLNMGHYYAHLNSSGLLLHSIDTQLGNVFSETATLAHTPGVLWRASGARIERRDDTTLALLSIVTLASDWGFGVASYRGDLIVTTALGGNANLQVHHLDSTGGTRSTVDTQVPDTRPAIVSVAPGSLQAWLPMDIWSGSTVTRMVRVSVTGAGSTVVALPRPAGFTSAYLVAGGLAAKQDGGFWVAWHMVTNQSQCVVTEHAANGAIMHTHDLDPGGTAVVAGGYAGTAALDVDATDNLIMLAAHEQARWRLLRIPPDGGEPAVVVEQLPSSPTLNAFANLIGGGLVAALHVERPPYGITGTAPRGQVHFVQVRR